MGGLVMPKVEIVGYIGAGLMVVTLAMRTMIPLRVVGIVSSAFQIAFALLAGITPMLIQHGILLPMNAWRLHQQLQLIRKLRVASTGDLSMEWLLPLMDKRAVKAGQTLFRKGDAADAMFVVGSGRLRLKESGLNVEPGAVVGELGLVSPDQQRTQTVICVEDAEIMQISYDRIKGLYFENPSFGFYFLRLTTARLFQNIARLETELAERNREIERLRAAAAA